MKYRYASSIVVVTLGLFAVVSLLSLTTNWLDVPAGNTTPTTTVSNTLPAPSTSSTTALQAASRGAHRTPVLPILERIAKCESGGELDPYLAKNRHSTASGKYQVLDTTWDGYFGYFRAMDAPPWVQEQFALELYQAQGSTPWNASRSCWG